MPCVALSRKCIFVLESPFSFNSACVLVGGRRQWLLDSISCGPGYVLELNSPFPFFLHRPAFLVKAMLGLSTYDSDDDTYDPDGRDYYCFRWNPQVLSVVI